MLKCSEDEIMVVCGYCASDRFSYHHPSEPAFVFKPSGMNAGGIFYLAGMEHNLNGNSCNELYRSRSLMAGVFHNITGPAKSDTVHSVFCINGIEYSRSDYRRILKYQACEEGE